MRQRRHHHLLADHPVEVAARQVVALPDEAQRLRAVQRLPAGREVRTGKLFVHRIFQADVDTAEGIGDHREPEQADLGVVVDGHPGQVGDGLDQRLPAGLHGAALTLGRVHVLNLDELLCGVQLHAAEHAVDLHLAQPGRGHVGVAGDGDRRRRLPVVRDADQDDGVGVGRDVVSGVQLSQLLSGQRVAVGVGTAVHPDQQDVGRAVVAGSAQHRGGEVEDAVLERPDRAPGDPGSDHDQRGQHRENRTAHRPPVRPDPSGLIRHFRLTEHQARLLGDGTHTG